MGGLMASAKGALSNCAVVRGRWGPGERRPGVGAAGASSMAEWQISQAEQAAVWCSCAAQPAVEPSQAAEEVASSSWWCACSCA